MTGPAEWPRGVEPLPDAERMRATDAWAIESRGIAGLTLMERAGEGLARVVEEVASDGPVVIVCGKGNNGGDGYVVARLLRERGRFVKVVAVASVQELGGDARANADRLPGRGPVPWSADALDGAGVVVDALLGTGVTGAPRGTAADAVAGIAAAGRDGVPVVACDVPSGVDASTGEIAGDAVRATATATFHAAKPGLHIHPGKAHSGAVHVVDIGIPPGAPVPPADVALLRPEIVSLLPGRDAQSTKFTSGHVLVAGGSRGLTGAPCLAADAAMRAGAGYVTACVPASLEAIVEGRLLEVMSLGLPDADGALIPGGAGTVARRAADRGGTLVLGPGLGRSGGALRFARDLAAAAFVPLVLDADGLAAYAGSVEALADRPAATVLTPHAGELARLLEVDTDAIRAARLAHVRDAARRSGAVVVLKGDDTLVAAPDGRVAVSPGGVPALATAGTGDVLAGTIGALLAQGLDAFAAAGAGVVVHVRAGLHATERLGGPDGVIASDVVAALPWGRRPGR